MDGDAAVVVGDEAVEWRRAGCVIEGWGLVLDVVGQSSSVCRRFRGGRRWFEPEIVTVENEVGDVD
jgi:hypothetical protein